MGEPTSAPTFAPLPSSPKPEWSGGDELTCPYAADSTCFDTWMYPCEQCCTTGLGANKQSCFNDVYTIERCCKESSEELENAVKGTDAKTCEYSKDSSCFDDMYPCFKCCHEQTNILEQSCWDTVFT